jgi:hypothetical protein
VFKPLNLFNKFNKNLKLIDFYYKKNSFNFKNKLNRRSMARFSLIFLKKSFLLKKFSVLSIYSQSMVFNNKLNMHISKNIKKVLRIFKKKKYKGDKSKRYLSVIKYFSLY